MIHIQAQPGELKRYIYPSVSFGYGPKRCLMCFMALALCFVALAHHFQSFLVMAVCFFGIHLVIWMNRLANSLALRNVIALCGFEFLFFQIRGIQWIGVA